MSEKYLGENSTPLLINQIKENCTQKRTALPIPSIDELGHIYQYMGTTSGSLVHGYFYECVSDGQNPATYSWQNINIQEIPTASDITFDNTTSGLTADDVQEAIDEVDSDIDNVKQALSDEAKARAELGAHNLLPIDLKVIKELNVVSSTWSDNKCTMSTANGSVEFTVNSNKSIGVKTTGTLDFTGYFNLTSGINYGSSRLSSYDLISNSTHKISGGSDAASATVQVCYDHLTEKTYIRVATGATGIDVTAYPMITLITDSDPTYHPYAKTNVELTQGLSEVQDLVLDQGGITTKSFAPVIAVNDALPVNAVDVQCKIEPIQAGSGTPSPSNVRAISGRSSAKVTKAQAIVPLVQGGLTDAGGAETDLLTRIRTDFIAIPEGEIQLQGLNLVRGSEADIGGRGYYFYDTNKNFISYSPVTVNIPLPNNDTAQIPNTAKYYRVVLQRVDPSVNVSADGKLLAINYINTVTIQLGDTYYGGTLDVTTGVLTVDRAYAEFDGSVDEQWQSSSTQQSGKYAFTIMLSDVKLPSTTSTEIPLTCNEYVSRTSGDVWKNNDGVGIYMDGRLWVYESSVSDNSSVNSWLAFLANNPIQLVYPLATPITIQLTPQEIQMLQGNNTIFTDSGDTSIQYYANGVKNLETVVAEMQTEADGAVNNQFQNGAVNLFENKASSVAHSSVTAIVNNDKTITINGAPSSNFVLQLGTIILDSTKKYKLSGCPKNQPTNTQLRFTDNGGNNYFDYGDGVEFTGASSGTVYLICYSATGNIFKNAVFKPMITYADVPNSDYAHYVPYAKSNKELTEDVEDLFNIQYFDFTTETSVYVNTSAQPMTYTTASDGTYRISLTSKDVDAQNGATLLINGVTIGTVRADIIENNVSCILKLKKGAVITNTNSGTARYRMDVIKLS